MSNNHKIPPGPRGLPYFGSIYRMSIDPLQYLPEVAEKYGDVTYLGRTPAYRFYMVSHPDHVKHIFVDEKDKYTRDAEINPVRAVIGNGLIASEGPYWLQQRRLMQPAFHRRMLPLWLGDVKDAIADQLQQWKSMAAREEPVDIMQEMIKLAVRVTTKTMFSVDLSDEAGKLGSSFNFALDFLYHKFTNPLSLPQSIPTPRSRRFREAVRAIHKMAEGIIDEQYANQIDKGDLLSTLILARDAKSGEGLTRQQIFDEVLAVLVAGFDATSSALSWTWYLLAKHPEALIKVQEEGARVCGDNGPTFEDLSRLTYIEMVFNEAMRLYPPGWLNGRVAQEDDVIDGYHIPAKSLVMASPYVLHRHPKYWDNPTEFDPTRFSPESSKGRSRFVFVPFSGGSHICIGRYLALMESKVLFAMALRELDYELVEGHPVEPVAALSLRPKHGIFIKFKKRDKT
ncbi:MAG: cytochrome P450 [Calditrichaeota bacterium]|nr:cytochrome P450 [Calditrichota bacterium]